MEEYDVPFTVLVPESATSPITVFDGTTALKMAVVNRNQVRTLPDAWDSPGVYILLDPVAADGTWGCYAGKSPSGVRERLKTHLSQKDHWNRALIILRDTSHGFNSAHTGWLEGRLYDMLEAAENAVLHNSQRPKDDTLAEFERGALELCNAAVARMLRVLGHDPSPAGEEAPAKARKRGTSAYYGITILNLIEAGLLTAGEALVSTNATRPASATICVDGKVSYNGVDYASPSTAGGAVRNGTATNGWSFWAVYRDNRKVSLANIRAQYQESMRVSPHV